MLDSYAIKAFKKILQKYFDLSAKIIFKINIPINFY